MNIIGILGSSRKNGNTEILLDLALEEAQKNEVTVSKISLSGKKIAPCDGCQKCIKTGKCVIKDDMQEIYSKMLESEGIIWATPVYFWSMTGQTKTVMDRTYALVYPRLQLMNKVGGLISVAGGRGCMNTANIFHMYFSYNHMFFAEFASGYATAKGEITKNTYAINATKEMVHQMIALIKANLEYPEEFHSPLPRFVREKYNL
ncbi:flavodoxin family protein [Thermodesulfobacteriota bacterium]